MSRLAGLSIKFDEPKKAQFTIEYVFSDLWMLMITEGDKEASPQCGL